MTAKRIIAGIALLFLISLPLPAQENAWKGRAKYVDFSYGLQTIKSDVADIKSDFAFAFRTGRTFYLHRKPLAGILKFGIDWNYFDLNFAKYSDFPTVSPYGPEPAGMSAYQLEAGIGAGPSATFNPAGHLNVAAYFHITPSYSLMLQNSRLSHSYSTFFNAGLSVAYKAFSIGVEYRWCGRTVRDDIALGEISTNPWDDNGNFLDPFRFYGIKSKTNTLRLSIGFRY